MDRKKFSSLLIRLRKERNLTQQDFAEIFNVSYQAVSKWENGESLPDIITLENLSAFYKISINDLLNGIYNTKIKTNENDKYTENDIKDDVIKENIVQNITIENQIFSLDFAKNNIFKIIWCTASIILFLFLSILPVLDFNFFSANFYSICFSSDFRFGNFLVLISFFLFITKNILGIFSSFVKNNKILLLLEETFSIYCFITLLDLLAPNFDIASIGLYLLIILFATSWITHVFCKKLNFNAIFNNLQLQLDRATFLCSLIIHFIALCTNSDFYSFSNSNLIIYTLIYLALLTVTIIFYSRLYFKPENKKYTIIYYVFFYLSFTFIFAISLSYNSISVSIILKVIITIAFEIIRNIRNKNAKQAKEKIEASIK